MYFAIFIGCNKVQPQILAVGKTIADINKVITDRLDKVSIENLAIYKDNNSEYKDSVNNDTNSTNDITKDTNDLQQNNESEYECKDTPYCVCDIPYPHVISYVLTKSQATMLAENNVYIDVLECCSDIISVFETDETGLDFFKIINYLNIE